MKKQIKKCVCIGLTVALLSTMLLVSVSAEKVPYVTEGSKFAQGIGSVDCLISVDPSEYPEMYAACGEAIKDWDWHLGLLNAEYGVDWNLVNYTGTDPYEDPAMIEFCAMTAAQYANQTGINVITATGNTVMYGRGSKEYRQAMNEVFDVDWSSTQVTFITDNLQNVIVNPDTGKTQLHDFYSLREIANHEIGHALGLDHNWTDTGVIMYPNDSRTAEVPTEADLEGIYYLYG